MLDLACGTGQNFPYLAASLGREGHIIGLDVSNGMLRRARRRISTQDPKLTLIHAQARDLTPSFIQEQTSATEVDLVLCTYGFTAMRDPEAAFHASWKVLKPGGTYLSHDIHAAPRTLHARAVEWATFCRFSERAWRPLQALCPDFRMDYLDPSAHLFGGRVFVAWGTKPLATPHSRHGTHHQQGR